MSVLTRFRRVRRGAVKPLVMTGIAGSLALGLVAVPVAKAEADLLSAATIAEINGAMRMPLTQVVVNAIKLHPVGFALGTVASLGLLAYATKDQWMPYVTGDFGESTEASPSTPAPAAPNIDPDLVITEVLPPTSGTVRDVTIKASDASPPPGTSSGFLGWAISVRCKNTASGNINVDLNVANVQTSNHNLATKIVYAYCPTGYTPVGGVVGAFGADPALSPNTGAGPAQYKGPANVYRWGTEAQPGDPGFDPNGANTSYVVSAECIDSAGNLSVVEYTSKGTDGMLRMPPCGVLAPGTHGTGKMWIDGYAPGSTIPQRLYDVDPMTDPDHPLCSPSRPGSGCTLGVSIDGKPCVIGDIQCENWTEIRRDDQTGARVSCNYGPYLVGVEQCNILERAYQIGGAPATDANIDGNPSTSHYFQPNGDPWKPQPQPSYSTGTGTTTAPGGFPTSGTSGNPNDPCLKDAWSWTPADWVKNPVVCALQDAFVPKQDVQARSNELKQKAMDTVPIAWLSPNLTGPGNSGCPNWTINVAGMSENVVCNSSFTQALLGVRAPLFGLVAAAMVWPLIRGIWYASIPVLRVSPGSSK